MTKYSTYFVIFIIVPILGLFLSGCFQRNVMNQEINTKIEGQKADFALVVHGGAGTILKRNLTNEMEKAYHDALSEALKAGYAILENGGSSLDAIEAAIRLMEDSPLFNAGKGAAFTNTGTIELDASIMDGRDLQAGAVAAVKTVKNPISAARRVMEKSPHVLLMGAGADRFAKEEGLEMVDTAYFFTQRRWDYLQKLLQDENQANQTALSESENAEPASNKKFGTVGAVALDKKGNLAAATSTGGMTNKKWGRVGDSPIIGAGTYADNRTCAVSATGHGEYFMRNVVCYDIAARMRYKQIPLAQAAKEMIMGELKERGGQGGVIAIDQSGNIAMPFNTSGMYRGYVLPDGEIKTFIFESK